LSNWAIEAQKKATSHLHDTEQQTSFEPLRPAKVKGTDALNNYVRGTSSHPNLIGGLLQAPDPHHSLRVKPEGHQNYLRSHDSRVKSLFENYGKFERPDPTRPHTQGAVRATLNDQVKVSFASSSSSWPQRSIIDTDKDEWAVC
jgi:hypothetical protein